MPEEQPAPFSLLEFVRDLFRVLSPIRYSFLVFLIGAISFLVVPQGQDILRRMVEWDFRAQSSVQEVAKNLILFVVSVLIWAASTWYWARVILYLRAPGSLPDTRQRARLREWIPRLLGFLAIVSMSIALFVASRNYLQYQTDEGGSVGKGPILRLQILSATLFILSLVFLAVVTKRRDVMQAARNRWGRKRGGEIAEHISPTQQYEKADELPTATRWAIRWSLIMSLILGVLFAFWPVPAGQFFGTLPIVLLAAANFVLFGTGLLYLSRRFRLPLLLPLLILAVIFSRCNDNHAMRLVEKGSPAAGQTIQEHFQTWQGNQPGRPIFIVAAEGGGIRAAYWAAIALGRLEDDHPGFSRQVFAVSGISGGSLGAAVFAALVAEKESGRDPRQTCGGFRICAAEMLGQDFLSPPVARMVAPDLVQRFWFHPLPFTDRAQALEDSWAKAWESVVEDDRFDGPFQDLWQGGLAPYVPSLVLNGTHVESGRRIVATNLRWNAGEFRDTYDLLRVVRSDLPLKTAVHNSARFTYVSPAGTMRPSSSPSWPWWGHDRGHVVDGGYFENSGTTTALELARAVQQACGQACKDRIYVIYLRNSPATNPRLQLDPGNPDETLDRPLEDEETSAQRPEADPKELEPFSKSYPRLNELLSPPRALLNTRNARGSLSVKAIQAELRGRYFELGLCERVQQGGKLKRAPLPLGWQLSETSRKAMDDQLERGCRQANNRKTRADIGRLMRDGIPFPQVTAPVAPAAAATPR